MRGKKQGFLEANCRTRAGWQGTQVGEREVKKALRKALFKYKLHADEELFEKAYSYIRQYY